MRLLQILLFICPFMAFHTLNAQPGFLKVFDDSFQETAEYGIFQDIVRTNDTLTFYSATSDSSLNQGVGIIQIDTFGNILNENQIIDPDTVWTTFYWSRKKIIETSDNNYAIIGRALILNGEPINNVYFIKVDEDLNLVSKKIYVADQFIGNASLIEDDSGFLIVCHIEQSNNSLANDILVIKTDKKGNELWRKQYGEFAFSETPTDIFKRSDNEYIIHGRRSDYPHWDDPSWPQATWGEAYMLAIDSTGRQLWEWSTDTTTHLISSMHNVIQLSDGLLFTGLSWELFQGGQHTETYAGLPMTVKLDKDLKVVWEKAYGDFGHYHYFADLNKTPDGNFLASGFLSQVPDKRPQGVHFKFTPQGDSLWMRLDTVYDYPHRMRVQATEILSSGSIISIGFLEYGPYGQTGFIMKLGPDGCMDTLNCFPVSTTNPIMYDRDALEIYPNPARERITIEGPDRISGTKQIIVRNINGQAVLQTSSTRHKFKLNISGLISGHYFVELTTEKGKVFGRFVKPK